MGTELIAAKTPVEAKGLFALLAEAWRTLLQEEPKTESLLVLLAQWALETGHGKSVWNYNLGNVKATSSGPYDYCYFACNEVLLDKQAVHYETASPSTVKITRRVGDKCVVWFYPKHPGCCFRAFRTIEEGIVDYLGMMRRRFSVAWPCVLSGDPAGFCHELKRSKYYTADEAEYTKNVTSIFYSYHKRFTGSTRAAQNPSSWASAISFAESPVLSPALQDESPIYSLYSVQLEEQALLGV